MWSLRVVTGPGRIQTEINNIGYLFGEPFITLIELFGPVSYLYYFRHERSCLVFLDEKSFITSFFCLSPEFFLSFYAGSYF